MSELKRKILDTIAWIALIVGIIMILWRIFGNSPTDLAVISPFIVLALSKVWSNNDKIWELKIEIKHGFEKVKGSFDKVKDDMDKIGNKIDSLLNRDRKKNNKTFSFTAH